MATDPVHDGQRLIDTPPEQVEEDDEELIRLPAAGRRGLYG